MFSCCLCKCKDTKLKAIHNVKTLINDYITVVYANAKILNWKQFTTVTHHTFNGLGVVYANAKILNWKQFTTKVRVYIFKHSCLCKCKDTKLKAIHNK